MFYTWTLQFDKRSYFSSDSDNVQFEGNAAERRRRMQYHMALGDGQHERFWSGQPLLLQ